MGTRALGRLANSSHWNRSLASALLGSRESSFRSGKSLSSSYPVLGTTAGIFTSTDVVTNQSSFGRIWVYLISGVLSWGGIHTSLAEELSARPSTADNMEQEVQLVEDSLQSSNQASNPHTARWRIYTDMGRDLFSQGRLDEAEKYFVRALEEAKKGFGDRDPHVASSCNNLAELYRMRKEYAKAEPLFLESVQRLEQALGPMHESVAFALHNLAGTYLQQHNYELARTCYERSLKIKERKLGPNHPEYANTMFHLAEVLRLQGNNVDAEHLIRDSLRILEEGGVGHSQQAVRRMSRLAEILVHSGKLQEAEILQRKILHILEMLQGPESLSTITAVDNLATTLQALRKLDEAEELFLRCLQVRQKALSSTHILVGSTLFKLAVVTTQQADEMVADKSRSVEEARMAYERAEDMLRQAIRIAEQRWEEALGGVAAADQAASAMLGTDVSLGPKALNTLIPPLLALVRSLNALGIVVMHLADLAGSPVVRVCYLFHDLRL
uniref:Kinesin light chain n=1 Tax=Physcomitrium patens TaxID=3218 RepID=A0A7I4B6M8_PHYPA